MERGYRTLARRVLEQAFVDARIGEIDSKGRIEPSRGYHIGRVVARPRPDKLSDVVLRDTGTVLCLGLSYTAARDKATELNRQSRVIESARRFLATDSELLRLWCAATGREVAPLLAQCRTLVAEAEQRERALSDFQRRRALYTRRRKHAR